MVCESVLDPAQICRRLMMLLRDGLSRNVFWCGIAEQERRCLGRHSLQQEGLTANRSSNALELQTGGYNSWFSAGPPRVAGIATASRDRGC